MTTSPTCFTVAGWFSGVLPELPANPLTVQAGLREHRAPWHMSSRVASVLVRQLATDEAPLLAQRFYAGGDPGPITATLAHVPELLESGLPFIGQALAASAIAFRTKEMIILRTSSLLQCRYCIDSHTPVALDSGLTHHEVRALRDEAGTSTDDAFPAPSDRALIAWIDAVAGGRGPIPQHVNALVTQHFAEHEIVELTLTTTVTMLLNRYATSLQLPVGASTLARLAQEGFQ